MAQPPNPVRVLVVDDDAMSRELLSVLLAVEGYAVESADSGEAALATLKKQEAPPQLILTDIQLPGVSGSRLAAKLRRACPPSTLLLAMSGSQPPGKTISSFDGFLLKPFKMEQVAAALSTHRTALETRPRAEEVAVKKLAERKKRTPAAARTSLVKPHPGAAFPSPPAIASKQSMEGSTMQSLTRQLQFSPVPAVPVLNETIYQKLAGSMPAKQLHEMYTLCVNDARERISQMRRLAASHDSQQFMREAHAIKGSCGMLGATQLHGMAAELERDGFEANSRQPREVNSLDELSDACDRLERMLGSRV